MNTSLRTRFLSAVIFFVLIASAVFTVPARADSGSPPPAPSVPGGSTHSTGQVPSGATNTAGGGDQGHKVELSSQNAAYIAPAGDPIWCPSGVAVPVPGAGGCSANYANLYSLTNDVETGMIHPLLTNSNIWVQHGADTSITQPFLDGLVLPALSNVSLNFKGGWNGLGTGSVNPATPSIFNGVGISIGHWHNNVTLSNITVNTALGAHDGFYVQSNKAISLSNDIAFDGGDYGAYLDNTGGTGITITNSSFTQNNHSADYWGLYVLSGGPITLTGVIVDQDVLAGGAYLDNSAVPNKPVVIKSSYFDNNKVDSGFPPEYGLWVLSQGVITLTNVSASGNYNASFATGALLDNTSSTTAAPVTLTGTNIFDSNANDGLDVTSNGKITSASLIASRNGGLGVSFDNSTAAPGQPVMLTGNSIFNNNNGPYGLNVVSKGAVLTNGLSAISNLGWGVNIVNDLPGSTAPVTLKGLNTFNNNGPYGLNIVSNGAVLTSGLTALSNSGYGVNIVNAGPSFIAPVTLNGLNTFNFNGLSGLNVLSNGAVAANRLTALSNSGNGVSIINASLGSTAPVTLKGLNTFNNNGSYGLYVGSNGAVVANSLTAIYNSGTGAYIVNNGASSAVPVILKGLGTFNFNGIDGLYLISNGAVVTNGLSAIANFGSYGAFIINAGISSISPVTLNGINTFDSNMSNGLYLISNGAVVANSLTASDNLGSYGAYIINAGPSSTAPVTLKGLGTFNDNNGDGLYLISKGAVLTGGLIAIANGGDGAYIVNGAPGSTAPVTLKGLGTFNGNGPDGLYVISNGAVVTNGLTALSNLGFGASIDNSGASFNAPVTLKGLGTFNGNGPDGLYVISNGAVVTNGLTALSNSAYGAFIVNAGASSTAPVTLNGLNTFNFNGLDGLYVISNGAVVANSLTAISNIVGNGAYIINSGASFNAPVTLKGLGTFNHNGSAGLYLISRGAVLTGALTALSNTGYGVNIVNGGASFAAPVTLKGLGTFNSNNGSYGLYLASNGTVVTNGLNAISNNGFGVYMDNSFSSINSPVTLNGLNILNNNSIDGLVVLSKGAITTDNLTASNNGILGAYLDNGMPGAAGAVNVKGKNIVWNNSSNIAGLDIISYGPVTVTNISSKWNGADGLLVNTPGNVVVSCGSFFSNGTGHVTGYGWETSFIVPHITLIGVTTGGNFSGDSHLDNPGTIVTVVKHPCVLP